jgi:ethanolamine utilization microcompartment shell protein EutS
VTVTVCPKSIILSTVAKPETVHIGSYIYFKGGVVLVGECNMNMASPEGEVTTTCLKGSQLSGRSGE